MAFFSKLYIAVNLLFGSLEGEKIHLACGFRGLNPLHSVGCSHLHLAVDGVAAL